MSASFSISRRVFTDNSTIGDMYINGKFQCHTLEDTCRRIKVDGETAIPAGTYEVILSPSQRYQSIMPRLLDVPGFTGILIHPGNTKLDTRGCILVGETEYKDSIGGSKVAFNNLLPKLEEILKTEKLFLTIVGGIPGKEFAYR